MFARKVSSLIKSWTRVTLVVTVEVSLAAACGYALQLKFNLMELLCQEEPNSLIET